MTTASIQSCTQARRSISVFAMFRAAFQTRRQRCALANLSAAALCDIGISAADALDESQKPFWHVPDHWVK